MAVEEELSSGGGDHRWTTATTATLQTRFNPCVIERLLRRRLPKKENLENSPSSKVHHPHHHHLHHFIIGTYELVEEGSELAKQYSATELAARNRRVGTLELLKINGENGELVLAYESPYGGVFDLRVLDDHDATHHHLQIEEEEDPNFVVTAHANGVVALYLIYCGNSARIELLKSWSTFAKMLTTVEIIKGGKAAFCFYAGAESGELLRVNWSSTGGEKEKDEAEEEVTSLGKLTDYGHPIWYLRAVEISVSNGGDHHLLFIGSEDSKWRVVVVVNEDSENEPGFVFSAFFLIILLILYFFRSTKMPLYVNADAEAGVTAFEFLLPSSSSSSSSSSPSSLSSSETSGELKVLVGSYDEHLRLYRMRFSSSSSTSKTSIDSVNLLYRIPITGGGVWRIRTFFPGGESSNCQVLISAMYAGVRLLTFDGAEIEAENGQWPKDCCQSVATLEVPNTSEKSPNENTNSTSSSSSSALIYGIAAAEDLSVVTFASFYQRELYVLFKSEKKSLIDY